MRIRMLFALGMVLALAVTAQAQRIPKIDPGKLPRIDLDGTISGVRPGAILVTTATNETWGVKLTPRTKIKVTGNAGLDVLRRGVFVRFTATVDKRRSRIADKVGKLTVFTPSQDQEYMPGVFYPGGAGADDEMQPFGAPPFGAQPPRAKRHAAAANKETFDIRARVVGSRKGKLNLYVPNQFFKPSLSIRLADDVVIDVDSADYSIAKSGDKLQARGEQFARTAIEASKVTIELAKPLDAARKKTPKKAISKRPSRRTAKDKQDSFEVVDEIAREKDQAEADNNEPPAQHQELPGDRPAP